MSDSIVRVQYGITPVFGKCVAAIEYQEWERLVHADGQLTFLDIYPTGFENLETIAATAVASGTIAPCGGMDILRLDPNDAPSIYNLDNYTVIERLTELPGFEQVLKKAGLKDSLPLRADLKKHVYFVKKHPGKQHWLDHIPEYIRQARRKCP